MWQNASELTRFLGKWKDGLLLGMGFLEALQRFGHTDPKEVGESMERPKQKKPPVDAPRQQVRKPASKSPNRKR
jgi:hypothetical protein